jgi:hypothetical protein
MQARIASTLFVLGLLACPVWAGDRPAAQSSPAIRLSEVSALRSLEDPALSALRAGAVSTAARVEGAERTALRAAEARDDGLQDLRAGDVILSDHDLTLIAIVAAVVIIILII